MLSIARSRQDGLNRYNSGAIKMGKNRILQHAVHAVLTAAAASAAVPAAYAQTAPAAPEIQEVVVTGSRIQSANLISASPITTVTNLDIQQSGLTRVEDILNNLP